MRAQSCSATQNLLITHGEELPAVSSYMTSQTQWTSHIADKTVLLGCQVQLVILTSHTSTLSNADFFLSCVCEGSGKGMKFTYDDIYIYI
jgi:hypothetical protein